MAKKVKKRELGKGIRALLSNIESNDPKPDVNIKETGTNEIKATPEATPGSIAAINTDWIEVNPFQPRNEFDPVALEELANSIRVHGLIQPVTVRRMGHQSYQLISGERRFRASKMAGITSIPAYIRTADDTEMLEMALIENIERENLNAIEIALTYQRLIEECKLTHEQMSTRIGKNRSTVSNYIRLLKLPPEIQAAIKDKTLSMGHARAMITIDDLAYLLMVFKKVKEEQLSVRDLEKFLKAGSPGSTNKKAAATLPHEYTAVQDRLSSALESKVALKLKAKGKGQILINFHSNEELNRLLDLIEKE